MGVSKKSNTARIYYLGSKSKIIPEILDIALKESDEKDGVCDLFTGSGVVARALSDHREVFAYDIQNYAIDFICSNQTPPIDFEVSTFKKEIQENFRVSQNLFSELISFEDTLIEAIENIYYLADFVENASFIRFDQDPNFLARNHSLNKIMRTSLDKIKDRKEDYVATWNFGGVYFSFNHTLFIDAVLKVIRRHGWFFLKASVLSLSSTLVNTIGKQFAQPLKPWTKEGEPKLNLYKKVVKDRSLNPLFEYNKILELSLNGNKCKNPIEGFVMDFRDALKNLPDKVSFIYADPPYTRDHYSRYYHVLETLSIGDIPNISRNKLKGKEIISKGLYREDRHQSPFCVKSEALEAFDSLFKLSGIKNASVLVSYSAYKEGEHPRVVKIEDIIKVAEKYYKSVSLIDVNRSSHNKLNNSQNQLNRTTPSEVFILSKNPNLQSV